MWLWWENNFHSWQFIKDDVCQLVDLLLLLLLVKNYERLIFVGNIKVHWNLKSHNKLLKFHMVVYEFQDWYFVSIKTWLLNLNNFDVEKDYWEFHDNKCSNFHSIFTCQCSQDNSSVIENIWEINQDMPKPKILKVSIIKM